MSKQASLIANNITNPIVAELIPSLDDSFFVEDDHPRQRGRGKDKLIGTSGVSVNLSFDPITTFSSNTIPTIPQGLDLPNQEDRIKDDEEDLFVTSSTSKGSRGQGHGGNKGTGKSFDITPSEEDSRDTHEDSESEESLGGPPIGRGPSGDHGRDNPQKPDSLGGPPVGRGPSGDHGGGEPEESFGNNLSFPVIWSEGVTKALRGDPGMTPMLNGEWWYWWEGDDPNTSEIEEYVSKPPDPDNNAFFDDGVAGTFDSHNVPGEGWEKAHLQKDADNIWQATNGTPGQFDLSEVVINTIDWGDNLESVDWYTNSQVRTEVVLFKNLETPVLEYEMRHTSGWGIDEVHGLAVDPTGDPILGEGTQATVYSNNARFTIQKLNVDRDDPLLESLTWSPGEGWTESGEDDLINPAIFNGAVYEGGDGPGYYSAEINVKGRIIYGYTWNVRNLNEGPGDYRLTFSFDDQLTGAPTGLNTFFRDGLTNIALPLEEETETITTLEESDEGGSSPDGGGNAVLDFVNNLSYIDVRILERESGGIGGGNSGQNDSLSETIPDFGAIASETTGFAPPVESSFI